MPQGPSVFAGLAITDLGTTDLSQQGGKAHGLVKIAAAGLPIPPTRVILTGSFHAFLAHNGLDLRPAVDAVHAASRAAAVRAATLPEGWAQRLVQEARSLGDRLAVRSSATDEDGTEKSFAGVHHTALGIPPEQVPEAVKAVWASAFDTPASAYAGQVGSMAVLLQPLLDPDCAGVVFTVNPQTGSWRELVVEAVRGQGEALVSGRQAPQWAVVRRPRDLPGRRVWNRLRLQVVQEDLVAQEVRWTVGSNGALTSARVDRSLWEDPLLSRRELLTLCRSCLRVEAAWGEPVDVEWAKTRAGFVLLQARPITRTGTPRESEVLWTRRFIGERWPMPPTPLSWSLLAPVLDWFISYPGVQDRYLGGGPALRRVKGHVYLNTTVFRHLLFKLPGAPAPGFMLELIPPDEVDAWRRRFRVKADWVVYRSIFATTLRERRWERFAFNPFTNHEVWDSFVSRFDTELRALSLPVLGARDAVQRVEAQQRLVREYLSIHVTSLLFANLWYQLLEAGLASWAPGGAADWMEKLAVCPPGNRTLETNQALWSLGQSAQAGDLEALTAGSLLSPDFGEALSGFLTQYGQRSEASWEIFSARWADDPSRLVPLLGPGRAPHERAGEQERAYREAQRELFEAVVGLRAKVLDRLLFFTRRYLLLRENQRFAFDQLLASMQHTLLTLGATLGIEPPEHIRWLTWDEVTGLVDGSLTELPDLTARQGVHVANQRVDPPVFLRGDLPVDGGLEGSRLEGLGISPGRVSGKVRVLRCAADGAALLEGEILVAPALDPGWTPLLLRAGGLVLELGSLLSHGAVVAREYGVPGVVNLSGVTRVLETGQEITVDGSRGLVWVHR